MRARLGQESHTAVRYSPGNKVLAQEADGCRRPSDDKVVRESKRDPTVLSDQVAHWGVTFDAGDQLVLLTSHHPALLSCSRAIGRRRPPTGLIVSGTPTGEYFVK